MCLLTRYPPTPPPQLPHQGGHEIGEMNTADDTERKKIDKKYRIEHCAWLLSYVTTKQNILVQTVNFSSFPFKSDGEKNYLFNSFYRVSLNLWINILVNINETFSTTDLMRRNI